ncbi:MAG: hypothetical protein IJ637_09390 [Prevotella sp.]|nr:hypothetical protein [Prevotella sp.]
MRQRMMHIMQMATRSLCMAAMLSALAACQESLEERCQRECREFTQKKCPMRIDQYTVMDSMTFNAQAHTITYAYTLNGMLDDSTYLSRANPQELLLGEVRNSTNLKLYKEAGYNFRYVYNSTRNKGAKLFDTTYTPSDYK